jgi:transcriptional regulator GlxA family with amidase domain
MLTARPVRDTRACQHLDGRKRGKFVLADKPEVGHDQGMDDDRSSRTRSPVPRQIAILIYPGVQSLDFTGPLEVFSGAQRLIEESGRHERGYAVKLLGLDGRSLQTSSGLTVTPHASLASAPSAIDTLIIAGGYGSRKAASDRALLEWVSQASASARRTASVCTGAFLLAAAGLLDGRRATTHWASAAELAARYPAVEVDPEPIFLRDGSIWTSAGVTAGMDLALALVEEDLDRDAALQIARHLVLFLRRPGNQSQFSATLSAQEPAREPLREVQRYVIEHPATDLSVETLAARACMSPRHFARAFGVESGVTPARYVEQVRLEAARRRLEDTTEPIAAVAVACGFGTAETMRRVFLRTLDVGPAEYRRRFHSLSVPAIDSSAA